MKRVLLQQVNIENKTSKGGKPYMSASIKVDGIYYNGLGNKSMESWRQGDTVTVELYEEEYNGKTYKKFKVPTQVELLTAVVKNMEARIAKLEANLVKPGVELTTPPEEIAIDDLPF